MVLTNIQPPCLKTTWIDGQLYYQQGSSLFHPVDRILKGSQTEESVTALSRACQHIGEQKLERKRFIGTTLHQLIEQYLQDGAIAHCSNLIEPYWQSVQPVLAKITNPRLVETAVPYRGQHPYAGKLDFAGEYNGKPCLIEWTTAEEPKGEAKKLYDKPLQLTAFCGAVNQYYDIRINYALIVVALPGEDAEIFEFNRDRLIDYWNQWHSRLKFFYETAA
jgi:genome maintenance exonuclease 1